MHLSQKQNTFSEAFSGFMKCSLNLEHFEGKGDPRRFCISEITDSKTWLDKCLKSPVSEVSSTSSMVKLPKHC